MFILFSFPSSYDCQSRIRNQISKNESSPEAVRGKTPMIIKTAALYISLLIVGISGGIISSILHSYQSRAPDPASILPYDLVFHTEDYTRLYSRLQVCILVIVMIALVVCLYHFYRRHWSKVGHDMSEEKPIHNAVDDLSLLSNLKVENSIKIKV